MTEDDVLRMITSGEGQSVEFKETLSRSCQAEGTQSLVAFANRDGGRVLFGVTDTGTLKGVSVGAQTIENLANFITSHTYPSLPTHIEVVNIAGCSVVIAEVASDRPPLIGLYLYAKTNVPLDEPVGTGDLSAIRRVGRTNQHVDLMWMRQEMASDPRLRLNAYPPDPSGSRDLPQNLPAQVWIQEPSASAHYIEFLTEPPVYRVDYYVFDLPVPQQIGESDQYRIETTDSFEFQRDDAYEATEDLAEFYLLATYMDDAGLTWEIRRQISINRDDSGVQLVPAVFSRRITGLPAKRHQGGSREP